MTTTFSSAAATARLTSSLNQTSTATGVSVNGNASAGTLNIYTTGGSSTGTLLCSFTLAQPPFSIAGKVATALNGGSAVSTSNPINATPVAGGTAAVAEFHDGGGALVEGGLTVGTSGTDVIVATTTFSTSIPAQLTSVTVTHP